MENVNLIDTFTEFKDLKNIDRATMMSVLEDVFRSMLQKKYESDENFDIIINIDKGDFEIWHKREAFGYSVILALRKVNFLENSLSLASEYP